MRFAISLFIDIVLVLLASIAAVILRDNFEFSIARLLEVAPYFVCTIIASMFALPLFGVNRTFWRLSNISEYFRLATALLTITVASVAMSFAVNRLEDVPRSLPFLQFYLSVTLLVGARVLYRLRHARRRSRRKAMTPLKVVDEPAREAVLLVGLSPLTETYLQLVAELAPRRIKIAGILGQSARHVGRLVAAHKVLGLPEELERVVSELAVNGVAIDRVVITASSASLSRKAREAIANVERAGTVRVRYLSEDLGFESAPERHLSDDRSYAQGSLDGRPLKFEIQPEQLQMMERRRYWGVKRALDIAASLFLLAVSLPVLIVIGLAVGLTMGWPPLFWQQRPGLGGRPFNLHKFRTMRPAISEDGRRIPDAERVSQLGEILRRTRLDELPQLFNILRGDMSFVGPRPLLPRDQDDSYRARLLVRPGLTGWAQVVGGREISAEDKAALDVWYVRNAGIWLDLAVVLRTILIIFGGERTRESLIRQAWQDLREAGVLKGRFTPDQMTHTPGR
jgi:lipopolysaccharide/colanic/teichoic acid biosynthesis glycosyltransferase